MPSPEVIREVHPTRNGTVTRSSVPPPSHFSQVTGPRDWARLGLVGVVVLLVVLVFERLLWMIAYPLVLVFAAVVLAQGLAPMVTWLGQWLPRALAVVTLYLALGALVAGSMWSFVPRLIAEASAFTENLPTLEATLRALAERWSPVAVDDLAAATQGYFGEFSTALLGLPATVFSVATNVVLILFISLYWLIAQPQLRGWVLGLVPDPQRDLAREVLTEVGQTVGGYVRGVALAALALATLTYLGLLLLGVPWALVLAVVAGLGELVPVVGPFLAAIPTLAVALATPEVNVVVVLAFYVVLQQVESNVLIPLIMRGQASIPPLLSVVAFLIGASVGGIVGALVAIPLFGAGRVVIVRVLVPAERRLAGVAPAEADLVHREEVEREEVAGDDEEHEREALRDQRA